MMEMVMERKYNMIYGKTHQAFIYLTWLTHESSSSQETLRRLLNVFATHPASCHPPFAMDSWLKAAREQAAKIGPLT